MHAPEVIRFGAFRLVPGRRELMFRGAPVTLGSRAFDLLLALIKRHGRLAVKSELMAEVWAGTVVDENNLAAQISALRKILACDPELSRSLHTAPGQGYRFVADIEFDTETSLGTTATPSERASGDALTLVVLPFKSLGSNIEQAYFAQGLSHTIATDLSRISGLFVISSTTAATFEGKEPHIRQVSRELGVRFVLTGSVQRDDRRLRINTQLVDGQSGVHIWSDLFDGDTTDLLALQDRITGRIANSIGREIFVAAARDGEARNIDPKANDLFMRGIVADNKPQSLECLREQETLFARAVELDPKHGDAWARLSRAIVLQATQIHAPSFDKEDSLARGADAAERAMAVDPGNARAHYAMGLVHVLRGDFERSALANETAIALDRNFALAHNNLGNSLVHLGKAREALLAADTALRLDPRGPQVGAVWTTIGFARLQLGEVGEAITCFSRGRAENPKLPRAKVGAAVSLALSGDVPAGRLAAEELLKMVPHYRLSQTIDACLPTSPPLYREFYVQVLQPGATLAGVPE